MNVFLCLNQKTQDCIIIESRNKILIFKDAKKGNLNDLENI